MSAGVALTEEFIDETLSKPTLFTQRWLKIKPRRAAPFQPFRYKPVQKLFIKELIRLAKSEPIFFVVLKARQLGVSSVIQTFSFYRTITHPGTRAIIMSHQEKSSKKIFDMYEGFYNYLPELVKNSINFSKKVDNDWQLTNESSIEIATAGSPDAVRSAGYNLVHLSEVAFWDYAEEIAKSLTPSVPKNQLGVFTFAESTANGRDNYFYELWCEAVKSEQRRQEGRPVFNMWRPLFYPWYFDHEYMIDDIYMPMMMPNGVLEADSFHEDEEDLLRKKFALEGVTDVDKRLAYRRLVIETDMKNDVLKFKQEFPSYPEEAFTFSENNCFDPVKMGRLIDHTRKNIKLTTGSLSIEDAQVVFSENRRGLLRIYKAPAELEKEYGQKFAFLIGVDLASGRIDGDDSAAVVITEIGNQIVQVATMNGKVNPVTFADKVYDLARFYDDAMVCPETNTYGLSFVHRLYNQLGWFNMWTNLKQGNIHQDMMDLIGWKTTTQSKEMLVVEMDEAITTDHFMPTDLDTLLQMNDYVKNGRGVVRERYGPASWDGHDDLVMTSMIAYSAWARNHPLAQQEDEDDTFRTGLHEEPIRIGGYSVPLLRRPQKEQVNFDAKPLGMW